MGSQAGRNITVGNKWCPAFLFYELRFRGSFTERTFISCCKVIHAFQICGMENKLRAGSLCSDGNHLCPADRTVLILIRQGIKHNLSAWETVKHLLIRGFGLSFPFVGGNVYGFRFYDLGNPLVRQFLEKIHLSGKGAFAFLTGRAKQFCFQVIHFRLFIV